VNEGGKRVSWVELYLDLIFVLAVGGLAHIIEAHPNMPHVWMTLGLFVTLWWTWIGFAVLNLVGLAFAIATGHWRLRQIYEYAYLPLVIVVWICGALGRLPRVGSSTKGEGTERRYFYGVVWAVCAAEPTLGLLWRVLPRSRVGDVLKLAVFAGILTCMGYWAKRGLLPRTRPIVPGEWAISD